MTLSKVGFYSALNDLSTGGTFPHGGGTVQTADQVTAGQEGSRHILLPTDLADQGIPKAQVVLLQDQLLCKVHNKCPIILIVLNKSEKIYEGHSVKIL